MLESVHTLRCPYVSYVPLEAVRKVRCLYVPYVPGRVIIALAKNAGCSQNGSHLLLSLLASFGKTSMKQDKSKSTVAGVIHFACTQHFNRSYYNFGPREVVCTARCPYVLYVPWKPFVQWDVRMSPMSPGSRLYSEMSICPLCPREAVCTVRCPYVPHVPGKPLVQWDAHMSPMFLGKPFALHQESRWWHDQNCGYFLSLVPCQVMSKDARKPNLKSQTKCNLYRKCQKLVFLV